jgi:hypothetical protein
MAKTKKYGRSGGKTKKRLGKNIRKYKKTLRRMNRKLSSNQYGALFSYFDTNKNRNIDFKEFKRGLRSKLSNTKISDRDLKLFFNYFDTNKNRNIDFNEFKRGLIGGMNGDPSSYITPTKSGVTNTGMPATPVKSSVVGSTTVAVDANESPIQTGPSTTGSTITPLKKNSGVDDEYQGQSAVSNLFDSGAYGN